MSMTTADLMAEVKEYAGLSPVDGVEAMLSRVNEFPSPMAALLSGIGVDPGLRARLDQRMDEEWNRPWVVPTGTLPEVVIGSGPHALIYAAIRAAKGVKVVVLEKNRTAGGSFACSKGPSFWLNSRNRPGPVSLPGEGMGLNVLPGCPLQPSMIGGGEYQTNADMAWTIRMNLMMLPNVEVRTGVEVTGITSMVTSSGRMTYNLGLGGPNRIDLTLNAQRVVVATGLGDPMKFDSGETPARMVNFSEFMAMMDRPFPLAGMGRVAVIGAGDSGKTAIETLLGQGPSTRMSVAALDFPTSIDWYGQSSTTQADFCSANRGRYSRIGKALGNRVTPLPAAEFYPSSGYETAQVGPRIYDWVINCVGYRSNTVLTRDMQINDLLVGGRIVAKRLDATSRDSGEDEVYLIGPAANIPVPATDRVAAPALGRVPENSASIFRYAPLTAAFADDLPAVAQ